MPSSSIESYLRRAQEMLPKRFKTAVANARRDSILFWDGLVRDMNVDNRIRMYAQQQLDRRLGVDGPPQHQTAMPVGSSDAKGVVELVVVGRVNAKEVIDLEKTNHTVT